MQSIPTKWDKSSGMMSKSQQNFFGDYFIILAEYFVLLSYANATRFFSTIF